MTDSSDILTIALEDVRLYGCHGVMEQERRVGNEFRLDLSVECAAPEGCRTDSVEGTVSYADLYDVAVAEFAVPSALLEHVAHRITDSIERRWPQLTRIEVRIAKLTPPISGFAGTASVRLVRGRNDG